MQVIDRPRATAPTAAETIQEDQFEKALVDRDNFSPYHLNDLTKLFLGGLLVFGMILFYVIHISGHGLLGNYGQTVIPIVDTHLAKP